MVQYRRLGEILLERGIISRKQLAKAIKTQSRAGMRFGEVLTAMGLASEDDIIDCLSEQYDFPVADLEAVKPEKQAVALLDQGFAISHLVLPVRITAGEFECVINDPVDVATTDLIAMNTRKRPRVLLAPATPLLSAILAAYGQPPLEMLVAPALGCPEVPQSRRRRAPKIEPQHDREALLYLLSATTEAAKPQRGFWSRLMGS